MLFEKNLGRLKRLLDVLHLAENALIPGCTCVPIEIFSPKGHVLLTRIKVMLWILPQSVKTREIEYLLFLSNPKLGQSLHCRFNYISK